MNTQFIAPAKVKFLLADDVRAETNGKATIVGLFPDDRILVSPLPRGASQPPGLAAFISQLTAVAILIGGKGQAAALGRVAGPEGQQIYVTALGQVDLDPAKSQLVGFKFPGFPVPQFGKYVCTLELGTSKKYDFPFEIHAANQNGAKIAPTSNRRPRKTKRRES